MQLFGSGPILNEALRAQQILAEKYDVAADVWSVTSYNELRRDALDVERWNRLHPGRAGAHAVYRAGAEGRRGPHRRRQRLHEGRGRPDRAVACRAAWKRSGTDGFGRSDNREYLRKHFEINAESIAAAALSRLARDGKFDAKRAAGRVRRTAASTPRRSTRRARVMQIGQRVAVTGMVVSGALAVIKIYSRDSPAIPPR